jgi:hypothetical protein
MVQFFVFAIGAGLVVAVQLMWIAWELRAGRNERRILEVGRADFEAKRVKAETANAHAMLEVARRLDATERERRAREDAQRKHLDEVFAGTRALFATHDDAMRKLGIELYRLNRTLTAPLAPPRLPSIPESTAESGIEVRSQEHRAVPPPPPSSPRPEAP